MDVVIENVSELTRKLSITLPQEDVTKELAPPGGCYQRARQSV
jgi:hypothetical protein